MQRYQKLTYGYRRGNVGGGDKSGAWGKHTHSTMYKIATQQGPTIQHKELSLKYPVITNMRKEQKNEYMYMYN